MKKVFDKVLIVMLENQYRNYVMQDPFMKKLAAAGCNLTNYFGAFHPSQTNYLASLAGEVCGVTDDDMPDGPLMQENLTSLMQPKDGIQKTTWKAYMQSNPNQEWNKNWKNPDYPLSEQPVESYPNDGINLANYFRVHNPFSSFHDIQSSQKKWENIADENTFWNDVYKDTLPEYSWFTPDIWNNGHYLCNSYVTPNPRTPLITQSSQWLQHLFLGEMNSKYVRYATKFDQDIIGLKLDIDLLLTNPKEAYEKSHIPKGTLVVVTWDEADYDAEKYDTEYDGQNQIYTVLLGDMITPGTSIETPYNHFSLLKTIENNFGLGSLNKNDKDANWFRSLWGEKFNWTSPVQSNIQSAKNISTVWFNNQFSMVFTDANDNICWSIYNDSGWSKGQPIGVKSSKHFALEKNGNELIFVFTQGKNNELFYIVYTESNDWSEAISLAEKSVGHLTITTFEDYESNDQKVLLAWRNLDTNKIYSLIYSSGNWQKSKVDVGQFTDGPIAACALGASIYLVYKECNTFNMRMTSYNTAPFNTLKPKESQGSNVENNNTTLHKWSPMHFLVGHFSKRDNQMKDEYLAIGQLGLAAIEGEMHLVHHPRSPEQSTAFTTCFGLTGIYTAESEQTNGFGTLNQAGWTSEKILDDILLDPKNVLSIASNGNKMMMVYKNLGTNDLYYSTGEYTSSQTDTLKEKKQKVVQMSL